jgi:hypothetical protein
VPERLDTITAQERELRRLAFPDQPEMPEVERGPFEFEPPQPVEPDPESSEEEQEREKLAQAFTKALARSKQ